MMNPTQAEALNQYSGPWLVFSKDKILVSTLTGDLPRESWQAMPFLHHYASEARQLPPLEYPPEVGPQEIFSESLMVVDVGSEQLDCEGWQWASLRHLLTAATKDAFREYARAWQYVHFLRTHRFCGQCGATTNQIDWEMALQCNRCGHRTYPRVSPCIIVAIYSDSKLLLAKGVRHKELNMYSTLAGFVESGETLEQAVHREVMEEVGVRVKNLEYFDSQPWPFPHSLMVGFIAEYAGGEIKVDDNEIVDAYWFDIDALPNTPPKLSIAGRLIEEVVRKKRSS